MRLKTLAPAMPAWFHAAATKRECASKWRINAWTCSTFFERERAQTRRTVPRHDCLGLAAVADGEEPTLLDWFAEVGPTRNLRGRKDVDAFGRGIDRGRERRDQVLRERNLTCAGELRDAARKCQPPALLVRGRRGGRPDDEVTRYEPTSHRADDLGVGRQLPAVTLRRKNGPFAEDDFNLERGQTLNGCIEPDGESASRQV